MNPKMLAAFVVAFGCLYVSCKRNNPAPEKTYESYAALKAGNYWIYQIFDVDSAGNGSPTAEYDSCYVGNDTVVRGQTYHYLGSVMGATSGYTCGKWLRDSLSFIIDIEGRIWFSSEESQSPFASYPVQLGGIPDTVAWVTDQMDSVYRTTAVPAGLFLTLDCKRTVEMWPLVNGVGKKLYAHRRYSLHVGIVSETLPVYLVATSTFREKRLVRFHLN